MRKYVGWFRGIILFIILSNFPPVYGAFRLFGDGVLIPIMIESEYITRDTVYVYGGRLGDADDDPYFRRYKLLNPTADFTLYRLQPIQPWKFWRWYEYLTEQKWRQPYMDVPYAVVYERFYSFGRTYAPYYGNIPATTHQDSVAAAHPTHSEPLLR